MNAKLENNLMKEFSFMEGKNIYSEKPSGSPVFCECRDGWYDIIWDLCYELRDFYTRNGEYSKQIEVLQVKEKYGGLRFYTGCLIGGAHDIIDKYEKLSLKTCEVCGKDGELTGERWLRTLCSVCYE